MQLVTSLTIDASRLRKLLHLWNEAEEKRDPFAAVLVTPLFASLSTLRLIREELNGKRGSVVYFDSGGYYAQQGKISFESLYCQLRDYYREPDNQWADWYVLPDYVPTSTDSPETVERKVNETITAAKMFFAEMPSRIRERSIGVIQGHSFEQIKKCIEAYRSMGLQYLGFGSFGTSGTNNSINITDTRAAENIIYIIRELEADGVRLHTFGVSTPPVIYAFRRLGIYSLDSVGWLRSGGYGKVFLPYIRAYNVSHRSTKNASLSRMEFEHLKQRCNHQCPFCEDFEVLSRDFLIRGAHNLITMLETADSNNEGDRQAVASLIAWKSPRYYQMFKEIYLG